MSTLLEPFIHGPPSPAILSNRLTKNQIAFDFDTRMGLIFDSPFSIKSDAQIVATRGKKRHQSTSSAIFPSSSKSSNSRSAPTRRASTSGSFLSKILHPKSRSPPITPTSPIGTSTLPIRERIPSVPTQPFRFLDLPLEVRDKIYGYVVGINSVLHILLKHRPSRLPPTVRYRRCRGANSNHEACTSGKCRELSIQDGVYIGWFDSGCIPLMLSCRMVYKEMIRVVYTTNTFDFETPTAFNSFAQLIPRWHLDSIESLSFTLRAPSWICDSSQSATLAKYWCQMWDTIAEMKGLEEIRVRFLEMGYAAQVVKGKERVILEPMCAVGVWRDLRLFEVEVPWKAPDPSEEDDDVGEGRWEGETRPFSLTRFGRARRNN